MQTYPTIRFSSRVVTEKMSYTVCSVYQVPYWTCCLYSSAAPMRAPVLFQEVLQGASEKSPRAAEMQYTGRQTDEDNTKDERDSLVRVNSSVLCLFVLFDLHSFCVSMLRTLFIFGSSFSCLIFYIQSFSQASMLTSVIDMQVIKAFD